MPFTRVFTCRRLPFANLQNSFSFHTTYYFYEIHWRAQSPINIPPTFNLAWRRVIPGGSSSLPSVAGAPFQDVTYRVGDTPKRTLPVKVRTNDISPFSGLRQDLAALLPLCHGHGANALCPTVGCISLSGHAAHTKAHCTCEACNGQTSFHLAAQRHDREHHDGTRGNSDLRTIPSAIVWVECADYHC